MRLLNTYPIAFATFLLSLASCKPDKEAPLPVDNTLQSQVTPIQLPRVDDVLGAMYSIRVKHVFNGMTTRSEIASAVFYDNPSNTATATNYADAGTVWVNSFSLIKNDDMGYDRSAVEGQIFDDLHFQDSVHWVVLGDETVPPHSFAWSGIFPVYIGNFPSVVTRSEGLSFTFDQHTLKDADSVFVAISAGDKLMVWRYPFNIGSVHISSEELNALQACPGAKPGYLQISASVDDIFYPVDRRTVLVKQTTEIRTVIIK
jgi:hypothetical protein